MMNRDGLRPIQRGLSWLLKQHGWQRGINLSSLSGMRGFYNLRYLLLIV